MTEENLGTDPLKDPPGITDPQIDQCMFNGANISRDLTVGDIQQTLNVDKSVSDLSIVTGDSFQSTIVSGNGNTIVVYYQIPHQVAPTKESASTTTSFAPNPYKGLLAFQVEDAERFFGREKQVLRLWEKFRQLHEASAAGETIYRLLTVLGPSGSGKSSLVRAGLIPALACHPLSGQERMKVSVVKPDAHPLESLALVLARMATGDPAPVAKTREFAEELKLSRGENPKVFDGLRRIAKALPQTDGLALIVVVDQFEETFSLCKNIDEQTAFIGNLLEAASDPAGTVSVVLCLRSDFLGITQHFSKLNQVIAENGLIVPAMSSEELRRAIQCPAEKAGHSLDFSTVNLLIDQSGNREGALPLLQFALQQIWDGLVNGKQPGETLEKIGGVGGALAKEAQRIYDALSPVEQSIARQVFLNLVQLVDEDKAFRCRKEVDKLILPSDEPEQVKRVLTRFCDPGIRLITLSSGVNAKETAEITHESLFMHWEQLKEWIEKYRELLLIRQKLQSAAEEWNSEDRSPDYLFKGSRSESAYLLQQELRNSDLEVTELLRDYLECSRIGQLKDRLRSFGLCKPYGYSEKSLTDEEFNEIRHQLNDADLRGVFLRSANLSNANLKHAELSGATLVNADLRNADLRNANISRVDFHGANLTGADLTDARNPPVESIKSAIGWKEAIFNAQLQKQLFPETGLPGK
jgi:uncharacterized protein YjbI with pentapeptide repeats